MQEQKWQTAQLLSKAHRELDGRMVRHGIENKGSYSVIVVNPKETIRPIFQNRRGRINYARAKRSLGD